MAINQYKDGKGVNDYKKGNRTKGQPRNGEGLGNISKAISEDIANYKEIAEKVRRNKKYRQEEVLTVYNRLNAYIERQNKEDRPLTVSGMIKASGINKSTWYDMLGGEHDYMLYQLIDTYNIDISKAYDIDNIPAITVNIDGNNVDILLITWRELLEKAMLSIEEQTEERLYSKGRVGDIFALKAVHDWKEEASPQTVNQTLVLASPEQAREAINLLK